MSGRTRAFLLLALVTPFLGGCCCCERPFLHPFYGARFGYGAPCECNSCYGPAPMGSVMPLTPIPPVPQSGPPPAASPTAPTQTIPSFSSATGSIYGATRGQR
jgi:hypothetical protein